MERVLGRVTRSQERHDRLEPHERGAKEDRPTSRHPAPTKSNAVRGLLHTLAGPLGRNRSVRRCVRGESTSNDVLMAVLCPEYVPYRRSRRTVDVEVERSRASGTGGGWLGMPLSPAMHRRSSAGTGPSSTFPSSPPARMPGSTCSDAALQS